jgi:hypothetical protein
LAQQAENESRKSADEIKAKFDRLTHEVEALRSQPPKELGGPQPPPAGLLALQERIGVLERALSLAQQAENESRRSADEIKAKFDRLTQTFAPF